jgi:hypothetical protein
MDWYIWRDAKIGVSACQKHRQAIQAALDAAPLLE